MEYSFNSFLFPPFLRFAPALLFNDPYPLKKSFRRLSPFLHSRPPR